MHRSTSPACCALKGSNSLNSPAGRSRVAEERQCATQQKSSRAQSSSRRAAAWVRSRGKAERRVAAEERQRGCAGSGRAVRLPQTGGCKLPWAETAARWLQRTKLGSSRTKHCVQCSAAHPPTLGAPPAPAAHASSACGKARVHAALDGARSRLGAHACPSVCSSSLQRTEKNSMQDQASNNELQILKGTPIQPDPARCPALAASVAAGMPSHFGCWPAASRAPWHSIPLALTRCPALSASGWRRGPPASSQSGPPCPGCPLCPTPACSAAAASGCCRCPPRSGERNARAQQGSKASGREGVGAATATAAVRPGLWNDEGRAEGGMSKWWGRVGVDAATAN